ncbi:hypothetical protein VI817_007842 [Penicillium citrinum]|nr:hypothetical protein VI817_007842 [Penicillium citrinum]
MDLLPPHDPGDDSAISHDRAGEVNQNRAFRPFSRVRQPSEILDLKAFAPVVLPEQLGYNVGHRLRDKLHRLHRDLICHDTPGWPLDHRARSKRSQPR